MRTLRFRLGLVARDLRTVAEATKPALHPLERMILFLSGKAALLDLSSWIEHKISAALEAETYYPPILRLSGLTLKLRGRSPCCQISHIVA